MEKGKVISGEYGRIIVRQKSDQDIELGELLIAENDGSKILTQVFDLQYGSQLSEKNLQLVSGLKLEEENNLEMMDPDLRNYTLAFLKPMIDISPGKTKICKKLPKFFSTVREIKKEDLKFLRSASNNFFVGSLRSGSKTMDVPVSLPGEKTLSHHILIPGTTGRGKSVLMSNLLWDSLDKDYCGILVLDPHDEYHEKLKRKKSENLVYYTSKDELGARSLNINLKSIKPYHFEGVVNFSDPQMQALGIYYKQFGEKWIESILLERPLQGNVSFREDTIAVVRRRLLHLLGLEFANNKIGCKSIFSFQAGESTVSDICSDLKQGKTVITDTSSFSGTVELLIGSLIAHSVFNQYKQMKNDDSKPVISIVLEEAPRVLGKEVLEKGSNVFASIAREGRKFKVGLIAITQLPSLIPREVLANMNTKIILGVEMKPERQAIIESAAQDLSDDDRNIASLDRGEAIISSNFAKFAIPVSIPFFDEFIKKDIPEQDSSKKDFSGMDLS